jgi:5-formyltetrahydrofolate cyclo-ligase
MVPSWDEVRRWRREQRADLIARRQAIPQDERRRLQPLILGLVERHFPELAEILLGFYWPFRGEIGCHPLVRRLVERGARAALPVVVEKGQPLEFWAWRPGAPLRRGVWDIPIPAERHVVRPSALLVPLVGFDAQGYRLGYGGGYYDRTLAAMAPKPLTIGIGYELGRLPTICPQPHDVPMDAIVTEAGLVKAPPGRTAMTRDGGASRPSSLARDDDEGLSSTGAYASPPCFMHELDPAYLDPQQDGERAPADPAAGGESESERGGGSAAPEAPRRTRRK